MIWRALALAAVTLPSVACASKPAPQSVVVMRLDENEQHIRLDHAQVGNEIVCRRRFCTYRRKSEHCEMRIVGRATVVRLLSAEYSVVRKSSGDCAEGDAVELAH